MAKRHPTARRLVSAVTAGVVLCGVATLTTSSSSAAAPGDRDWTVEPVAGGLRVTLALDAPLPMVSDAPVLTADGVVLGLATESADGTSLSVLTTDDSVAGATDVAFAWSSGTAEQAEATDSPVTASPERVGPTEQITQRQLRAAMADGSAPGPYQYRQDDYDYGDQAIDLAGIGGIRGELTGRIYLPVGGGARPTVILLHGRHTSCATVVAGPANPVRWPCAANQTDVPSYKGYDGTAQTLATQGYAVVSISANAINANDNQLALDNGARARGQLVLDSLAMIETWNAGQPAVYRDAATGTERGTDDALDAPSAEQGTAYPNQADLNQLDAATLVGRFDLDDVGLMGHSRGGEGVTSAVTLNQALAQPYGIRSVLPLAPVDFSRMTVGDTPMLVMLPYCDGDVSNQQGQHFIDDSRYNHSDDVLLSTVWVMGADHNFFNTSWTPGQYPYAVGDDWSASTDQVCGAAGSDSIRLTSDAQYDVGTELMSAWFRLTLGGEDAFLPQFDGSTKPVLSATPDADLRVIGNAPSSSRAVIEPFTSSLANVRTNAASSAVLCASASSRGLPQLLPACATTTPQRSTSSFPHWTPASYAPNVPASPMLKTLWTSASTVPTESPTAGSVRMVVPAAARNATAYGTLSFKTAPDESVVTGTDMIISVVDGAGRTWSSPVSALNPLAVSRMPISTSIRNGAPENRLNKIVLQQVSIPVSAFSSVPGFDATDVREVRFSGAVGADGTQTGGAYLSDLVLSTSAVGTPVVRSAAATINVDPTNVEEGSSVDTRSVAVYLSAPQATAASGWLTLNGSSSTTSKAGLVAQEVTFAPGQTCVAVPVPVYGDQVRGTAASTAYRIEISNQRDVVYGAGAFALITVREDDGTTPDAGGATATPAPAVGRQGDACAERDARAQVFALTASSTTPAPGQVVSVLGTGFRPGESVSFSDTSTTPATVLGSAVADAAGSAALAVPGGTDGQRTITAVGAGSGRRAAVVLTVTTPTAPAPPVTGTPTVTTPPVVTTPGTTPPVTATVPGTTAPVASTLRLKVLKTVQGGRKVKVKVTVRAPGSTTSPTGLVRFTTGKASRTVVLPASGKVTVKVRNRPGKKVTAAYLGDALHATGTAKGTLRRR